MMSFFRISFLLVLFILCSIHNSLGKETGSYFTFYKKNVLLKKHNQDSLYVKKYEVALNKYKKGKYAEALKECLPIYEKSKRDKEQKIFRQVSNLLGDIYINTNNYDKSLFYYQELLTSLKNDSNLTFDKINKDSLSNQLLSKTYLQLGSLYQKKHRNSIINKDIKNSINFKDSAIAYYRTLENMSSFSHGVNKFKAISYYNLSGIYLKDTLYDKAIEYAIKAVNIHKSSNDNINLSGALNNLGNVYLSLKNFEKAKEYYSSGIEFIEDNNSQKAVKIKANLYYNLAWAMRNLKDYKAYDYQELSYEIEDSQREKEIRKIIEEITLNHKENLEKEKVNLVKEQRKLEEAQEAKTSMLFGALSFLVLIVSGVIIYNYKLRQKNLRLKLSESKLIQQQNLEKVRSEAQVKILNATIDGKETERKLIAEILHDNVSALLSSANMHLTATKKQFNGDMPQEIEKTQAIISEASQKVRDLSHNLVSSILLKFGLEYAIKDVVKKYSNSQLKLEVSAKNINRYNQEFEIKIFNVIQELINNILKHSKAKHAQIDLKEERNQLTVLVKDDGVGFSTSSSSFSDGIGLNQVEARIHMMDGKLTIKSVVNVGTSILIKVPILKKEKNLSKLTSVS
jgi:two-component system NarL family sensor kinase